jgi:DNA replication protein DnaC
MPTQEVGSMLDSPTIEKLKEMKLQAMAEMLSDPESSSSNLCFEDRFALMVEKQWLLKRNTKIARLLREAGFPINACIEDIRYHAERTIDKKTVATLTSCLYIEKKLNAVVCGKTGSGKSYIICALGNAACRKLYRVKYYRIPELLIEIEYAKTQGSYLRFMSSLAKMSLLILDDLGLKTYSIEESRQILEIAESRYNRTSTILSAQIEHSKWYELFTDPTIADAIMDRIIHNSYILSLDSKRSMRQVMAEEKKNDLN